MSRFFVPKEAVQGSTIVIAGPEAHHAVDVMRLRGGDEVVVFDGTGKEYRGRVREAEKKRVLIDITDTKESSSTGAVSITLVQAIPKKAKMDEIVEKATELGVASVVPVVTERTVARPGAHDLEAKRERWERIALAAAKQCGRVTVPSVEAVIPFARSLDRVKKFDLSIMACLFDLTKELKTVLTSRPPSNLLLFIGPEGDFSPSEIGSARDAGVHLVSLGPRVLRSDTAALAALAMIGYHYGD